MTTEQNIRYRNILIEPIKVWVMIIQKHCVLML